MKIAFVTSRFPFPVEKGDKLRAYHHLRWLGAHHDVYLFAISHRDVRPEEIEAVKAFCKGVYVYRIRTGHLLLNLFSGWLRGLPAQIAYFLDRRQRRRMQEDLIKLNPRHIFAQLIRTAEYVRILPVTKTLDYMDVFSVGATQRAETGHWLLRPFFRLEAQRLRRYEREVYGDFTHHLIISRQDRDRLPLPYQGNVSVVPNGVDLEYFKPRKSGDQRFDVVFIGNMGYLPNIRAAEFLVRQIMPQVWKEFPEAKVGLVGARPHRRVRRLASERIQVTGWVEDVRPYYAAAKLFVAPMLSGLGQQNKILEAMAMGLPCITTPLVDKAIGAAEANAILVADKAESLAAQICLLLRDPAKAEKLGEKARHFVVENYAWDMQNKALNPLFATPRESPEPEIIRV